MLLKVKERLKEKGVETLSISVLFVWLPMSKMWNPSSLSVRINCLIHSVGPFSPAEKNKLSSIVSRLTQGMDELTFALHKHKEEE